MDGERRAQPTCPKASNPYHKCEEFCSNRTAEPKPGGVKKETGGAKPCPKASNPYHKCEEFCSNRTADANPRRVKKQSERAQPCPRASNPSHKCDEFCSNTTSEANPQGVEKESGSPFSNTNTLLQVGFSLLFFLFVFFVFFWGGGVWDLPTFRLKPLEMEESFLTPLKN